MTARARRSRLLIGALACAAALSCAPPAPSAPPVARLALSTNDFVSHEGPHLTLHGRPWQFTGLNIYNLNSRDNCWYSMSGDDLSQALVASNVDVVRGWFFQRLATTPDGQRDFSKFDETLGVARAHGVRVIVTLADQWGACEPGGYKDATWYESRYRDERPDGLPATYREFVREIVTRYRDDPAILAWQLVNEPEVMDSQAGPCTANAAGILQSFVSDVGGLIKSIDPNHLVSVGTAGGGQCGAVYHEYDQLNALPVVDVCEYHDYGSPKAAMPGDQWNGLAPRLATCNALGKPLIVGELGIRPHEDLSPSAGFAHRAFVVAAKIDAARAAGAAGTLVWNWATAAQGGSTLDNFDVGPGDPLLAVLGSRASHQG